jgi:hypothetical protein
MEFSIAGSTVFKWHFFRKNDTFLTYELYNIKFQIFECKVCLSTCQWFNLKHSSRILSKFPQIIEHLRRTIFSQEKKLVLQYFFPGVYINKMDATNGARTAYPSGTPEFTPGFKLGSCYLMLIFMCMFCRSLFVLLYFFFWPLCCLFFFDLRILITPLVSLNSSYMT